MKRVLAVVLLAFALVSVGVGTIMLLYIALAGVAATLASALTRQLKAG